MKLSANTVTNYIKRFGDGGIAELIENRYYCPSSSLEPFMQCIECSFRIIPVRNAKDAVMRIEKMFDTGLPEKYTVELFEQKCGAIYQHVLEKYPQKDFSVYSNEVA